MKYGFINHDEAVGIPVATELTPIPPPFLSLGFPGLFLFRPPFFFKINLGIDEAMAPFGYPISKHPFDSGSDHTVIHSQLFMPIDFKRNVVMPLSRHALKSRYRLRIAIHAPGHQKQGN
ncbi:hypothetical protein DFAR_3060007 [Desulfarculales bacterium]